MALSPVLRGSIGLHAGAGVLALADPALWPWALAGIAANHAVLTAAGMVPRCGWLGENLTRLPATGRAELALTFDDGPDPLATPAILDLLDRHGARATFFCIGTRARAHPGLVREIVARGHAVENHSHAHSAAFACLPPVALRRDIVAAQETLAALTGRIPRFIRAPMGLRSPLLDPVLRPLSLSLVSWTRRALDGVRCDPGAALRRLRRGLRAGDILVLHDGIGVGRGEPGLVARTVLPGLLEACAGSGLRCVTLAEGTALVKQGQGALPPGPPRHAQHGFGMTGRALGTRSF
jgi:peptidoglycan-N-acetylglucosamine deacetylase